MWDPISRWKECARWRFRDHEHNDILEGRVGVVSATLIASQPDSMGKRALLISDSQVVIGVMSKGRSSVKALNRLARRVGAITLGLGMKLYWRHIRTNRNHADAPSRCRPFGTMSPDDSQAASLGASWNTLPEAFYQTRG